MTDQFNPRPTGDTPGLDRARELTLRSGQWLRLYRFRIHKGAPILGPGITTYDAMFDPAANDEQRRDACAGYLPHVRRQAENERWEAKGERSIDPYKREWCNTKRGAVLEVIAELLEAAVAGFDAAWPRDDPKPRGRRLVPPRDPADPSIPPVIDDGWP
jgi:hypothetical protein